VAELDHGRVAKEAFAPGTCCFSPDELPVSLATLCAEMGPLPPLSGILPWRLLPYRQAVERALASSAWHGLPTTGPSLTLSPAMRTPDFYFSLASPLALLGWALLVLAPRWRFTRLLVLSGALPLGLAAAYAGLIAVHYLGPHRGEGGFGSLAQVAALFRDPWALLAGWVHYLCFDLAVGSWETRDAHRRGVPHLTLVPCLLTTFLVGPLGLLLYSAVRRIFGRQSLPVSPPR